MCICLVESQCQQSVGEDTPWTGHLSTTGQVSVKITIKNFTTLEAKSTKTLGKHPVFKLVFTLNLVNQPLLSSKTPNELLYLQLKASYSSVPVVLIGQTATVM